jgi:hypothetical protein
MPAAGEQYKNQSTLYAGAVTRFHFVPYRGLAPAMQDLLAGRDLVFDLRTQKDIEGHRRQAQCRGRGCVG